MEKIKENKNLEEVSQGWGIASLVTGILGLLLFLMPYFGIVFSVFGIIASRIQKRQQNNGFATAGLVLGILGTILNVVVLVFVIVIITLFGL